MSNSVDEVKADFRKFMFLVWKHLNLPDPTPIQYDIAFYLQHGKRRIVIQAFRGVGKSWITSAFVCWLLLNDPQKKILVVSASKDRADQFSSFVKRLIAEMPILTHLKPKNGQRDSMVAFDVGLAQPDHSPSVKSVGIFGQLAGSRADIIIPDDIEVPNNSITQTMRDRLSEAVKEFDAILKPNGRTMYLGTPQTEMSLYNELPNRGYEVRIWPAQYPDNMEKYQGRLAPKIANELMAHPESEGEPTDPKRFDTEDLGERRLSYGKAGYALQFMLDTSLSDKDRYPLRLADLITANLDAERTNTEIAWGNEPNLKWEELPAVGLKGDKYFRASWKSEGTAPYQGCIMSIDPSGRGADETSYAVLKFLAGKLYLVAAGGFKGGYTPENLEKLCKIAKKHKATKLVIESNFGDGMFCEILKPHLQRIYPCTMEEVRHSKQKELRIIETLEPVISGHRLVVDARVIEEDYDTSKSDPKYSLFYQMTRLTRDRGSLVHDDRLDALAIAVAALLNVMGQDEATSAEWIKEEAAAQELEDFMEGILGENRTVVNVGLSNSNKGSFSGSR